MLIFPPSQSFNLYPYPVGHQAHHHRHSSSSSSSSSSSMSSRQMDNFAIADVESPDVHRMPSLARARGIEVTLTHRLPC